MTDRVLLADGPCAGQTVSRVGLRPILARFDPSRVSTCRRDGHDWQDYRYNVAEDAFRVLGPCDHEHECDHRPYPRANYCCMVRLKPGQRRHFGPHRSCLGTTWPNTDMTRVRSEYHRRTKARNRRRRS